MTDIRFLEEKAHWVKRMTLVIHKLAPGIRVASSLSPVEVLTALYYGGILDHDPADPQWPQRDRLILSKGHGSLCVYPILADRGYFSMEELERMSEPGSCLGVIPEPTTPGIETTNGSLGHGLGVASGMCLTLRRRHMPHTTFVLCGDGEMNSGAGWEAIMFAAKHGLDNLVAIIDDNKRSMLGNQADIMGLHPLADKFACFGWDATEVDGHDIGAVHGALLRLKGERNGKPKVLVANTIKGHGVPELERDPISHVRVMTPAEIDRTLKEWA